MPGVEPDPIIHSPFGPMKGLILTADLVAETNASVLITGETGVGKEILAQRIHHRSRRPQMEEVNCAGVPESLLESELFGHTRGSFTGAHKDRQGRFELAHHGTLFFDEVGEMSPKMQATLLRVLESGLVEKVGGQKVRVDVRVIAATKRNLEQMVEAGSFRDDLFNRLNVYPIEVPPLRERRADVPLLIEHFLPMTALRHGLSAPQFTKEAYDALLTYYWPGNVRELQNLIVRLTIKRRGQEVRPEDLPERIMSTDDGIMDVRDPNYYIVNQLYQRMLTDESATFWTVVYEPYTNHDLTREQVRGVIEKGLVRTTGNYRAICRLFNLPVTDYKRFMNFLRKNDIQPSFKEFRVLRNTAVAS